MSRRFASSEVASRLRHIADLFDQGRGVEVKEGPRRWGGQDDPQDYLGTTIHALYAPIVSELVVSFYDDGKFLGSSSSDRFEVAVRDAVGRLKNGERTADMCGDMLVMLEAELDRLRRSRGGF